MAGTLYQMQSITLTSNNPVSFLKQCGIYVNDAGFASVVDVTATVVFRADNPVYVATTEAISGYYYPDSGSSQYLQVPFPVPAEERFELTYHATASAPNYTDLQVYNQDSDDTTTLNFMLLVH